TIHDAITRTDTLKFNTYELADKINWLSKLDWMLKRLIIDTHEGGEEIAFSGYDADTDTSTELLAPAPYDEMYLRWLEAQIDLANGEIDKYNASIMLFNTEYEAYENYYNRNHMPLSAGRRFLF
ncbi:MAG: hypothetical protein IKV99_00535, partial [Oscillospiraceae bacterium]|nr:hypothetical protein [Oscillospiraceae bacterium]